MDTIRQGPRGRLLIKLAVALLILSTAYAGFRVYRQLHQEQLDQAMIQAIVDGKESRALTLLSEGADVNALQRLPRRVRNLADIVALLRGQPRGADGPSALALAVRSGREKVSLRLLERGAKDVHAGAPDRALLVWAVQNRQPAVALSLLAHGADEVNEPDESEDRSHSLLCRAITQKEEELALALMDRGAKPLEDETAENDPLYQACRHGLLRSVQKMLESGRPPDGSGYVLPLCAAASEGHIDVMRLLVEKGAHLDKYPDDSHWYTPLILAAEHGKTEAVRYLVERGAKPEIDGQLLLHATSPEQRTIVKYLIEHGARLNGDDPGTRSALCEAAAAGNVGAVRLLLECGADPNTVLREQNDRRLPPFTALDLARKNKHTAVVKELLKAGAKR